MRSKGPTEPTGAAALGALVAELAIAAGYDLSPGGNGRARLAQDTGMSVSAVGRMLRGETLPKITNVWSLAAVLHADENRLLDTAGYRNQSVSAERSAKALLSVPQPLTPEAIADLLGITNPFVRKMLTTNITEAVRLQREADRTTCNDGEHGGAAAAK